MGGGNRLLVIDVCPDTFVIDDTIVEFPNTALESGVGWWLVTVTVPGCRGCRGVNVLPPLAFPQPGGICSW